jgi:hypothetical protein
MLVFGTGQYFRSVGGKWLEKVKSRGFDPRDISRDALEALWVAEGRDGRYTFNRNRFVGYGTALRRIGGMWPPDFRYWRTFITETVNKSFDMTPRRVWRTDDPHDGRTVAPTQTLVKATEKADRAALARAYEQYDEARRKLEHLRTLDPTKRVFAPMLIAKWERRMWRAALVVTGTSGSPDHTRLFPPDGEPVAWGEDF